MRLPIKILGWVENTLEFFLQDILNDTQIQFALKVTKDSCYSSHGKTCFLGETGTTSSQPQIKLEKI